MFKLLKRLCITNGGTVALLIALMLPVVVGILILTVDLGVSQTAKVDSDSAADSAAYGTAEFIAKSRLDGVEPTPQQVTEYAQSLFLQNSQLDQSATLMDEPSFSVTVVENQVMVNSCSQIQISVFAQRGRLVCSESKADVLCTSQREQRNTLCTDGTTHGVMQERYIQCPSGQWSNFMTVNTNCPTPPECTTRNETR